MSSVCPKSTAGLRSCRASSGTAASSSARTVFSDPFIARPMGVRTASTITASGMRGLLLRANPVGSWYERPFSCTSEAEAAHAKLVPAQVVGELVAHGAHDLVAQRVGVMPEVAQQRVAVDHDPVGHVVAGHAVAVVEPVGMAAGAV